MPTYLLLPTYLNYRFHECAHTTFPTSSHTSRLLSPLIPELFPNFPASSPPPYTASSVVTQAGNFPDKIKSIQDCTDAATAKGWHYEATAGAKPLSIWSGPGGHGYHLTCNTATLDNCHITVRASFMDKLGADGKCGVVRMNTCTNSKNAIDQLKDACTLVPCDGVSASGEYKDHRASKKGKKNPKGEDVMVTVKPGSKWEKFKGKPSETITCNAAVADAVSIFEACKAP